MLAPLSARSTPAHPSLRLGTLHCDSGPRPINKQNTPVHGQLTRAHPIHKPPPQPNPAYDPPPKSAARERKIYMRTEYARNSFTKKRARSKRCAPKYAHNSTTKANVQDPNGVHPTSSEIEQHSECDLTSPDASRLAIEIVKYAQHIRHMMPTMRVTDNSQGNPSRSLAHARLSHSLL